MAIYPRQRLKPTLQSVVRKPTPLPAMAQRPMTNAVNETVKADTAIVKPVTLATQFRGVTYEQYLSPTLVRELLRWMT